MLGETTIAEGRMEPLRWWLAPSWLGLDAPCVVLTWTWAASRAVNAPLPLRPAAALFLVVWFIYLSDRLMDVASCRDWSLVTGRLRFGRNCRPLFLACQGFCFASILGLLWAGLPRAVILRGAFVGLGVGLHFLTFVRPVLLGVKLPGKEFGVGLYFALGAYACLGATTQLLPLLAGIAAVVAFNCLVIAARDADCDRANDPGGASHWWQNLRRDLLWMGVALTLMAALISVLTHNTAFYLSVTAALAGLTALHANGNRLSGDTVRALADFALLTPIPIVSVMKCASGAFHL